jgi:UDP-3-O-acyl-N-acetylglucosamine deacetylase
MVLIGKRILSGIWGVFFVVNFMLIQRLLAFITEFIYHSLLDILTRLSLIGYKIINSGKFLYCYFVAEVTLDSAVVTYL